jgi:cysteine sulfinate desulfinase/cysteine desulfurase-like protein
VTWTAREQVAELIGAHSMDVIFTSCATEAIEAYSRQLAVKAFSILAVNCELWTVNWLFRILL